MILTVKKFTNDVFIPILIIGIHAHVHLMMRKSSPCFPALLCVNLLTLSFSSKDIGFPVHIPTGVVRTAFFVLYP